MINIERTFHWLLHVAPLVMEGSNLVLATITDHEYPLRPRASRAECGAAGGAAEFGDVFGASLRGLVWTRRWRSAKSGWLWCANAVM